MSRIADSPVRGTVAAALVLAGALVGMLSVVFILLFGQSRILWAMSRDSLLPWTGRSVRPGQTPPPIWPGTLFAVAREARGLDRVRRLPRR